MNRTSKLVSNITYNTPAFLERACNKLVSDGYFTHLNWIYHVPDNEIGKTHCHILGEPNGLINLDVVSKYFIEIDIIHPDKPLKCMQWRTTKNIGDWLYYCMHDDYYLQSKGYAPRDTHYLYEDFFTTDRDMFNYDFACKDIGLTFCRDRRLIEAIRQGLSDYDIINKGILSPVQYGSYSRAINVMRFPSTIDKYNSFQSDEVESRKLAGIHYNDMNPQQQSVFLRPIDDNNPFDEGKK